MSEEQITALATICMAVMDGLQIQWLLDPETDMAANFEVFGEIVQRAIASPSAPSVAGADGMPRIVKDEKSFKPAGRSCSSRSGSCPWAARS
jgi:hypothetical protein